jgi:ketosteroid isomerase-like protein
MRIFLAIAVALCYWAVPAIGSADPPQAGQPLAPIMALAQSVLDAANANDPSRLAGLYTGDAIVIDELSPFTWTGPNAGAAWLTAVAQFLAAKKSSLTASALAISEYRSNGDAAYMVQPLRVSVVAGGKTNVELGTQTYTFRKVNGVWKISSAVWTTKP